MFVYISNAADGQVGCHRLDDNGTLGFIGNVPVGAGVGPLAVRSDGRVLIAASRTAPMQFHSFAIDRSTGELSPLGRASAHDSFPYIVLDATGRWLLSASYSGSLVAVNAVGDDGVVGEPPAQVIPVGRNAHAIRLDATNRYAYVPTLGSDQVFQFVFDPQSGRLASNTPAVAMVKQGSGPRHLAFSRDNRILYVLNEMHGTVTRFAIDGSTGLLTEHESVLALPPDTKLTPGFARGPMFGPGASNTPPRRSLDNDIWAADLHLTHDGRFLYASERTSSTIALFHVDAATGKLAFVSSMPTEKQPRGFAIDPSDRWMIVVGEKSERIAVYTIDASTGELRDAGRYPGGNGASWVEIVPEAVDAMSGQHRERAAASSA